MSHSMATTATAPARKTLSAAERAEIEAALAGGHSTQTELAASFGVSRKTISRIANPPHRRPGVEKSAGQPTSVYLKGPEREALDQLAAQHGYRSRSHLLAHFARIAAEITAVDAESAEILRGIATQLRGVAVNINQMARAANRGQLAWTEANKAEMQALARSCGQLARQAGAMASTSARKVRARHLVGQGDG